EPPERHLAGGRRAAAPVSRRRVLARRLALRVPPLPRAARRAGRGGAGVRAGGAGGAGGRRGVGRSGEGGGPEPHGEAPRSVACVRADARRAACALRRGGLPGAARGVLPAQVGAGGAARAVVSGGGGRGEGPADAHRLARGRRARPGDAPARGRRDRVRVSGCDARGRQEGGGRLKVASASESVPHPGEQHARYRVLDRPITVLRNVAARRTGGSCDDAWEASARRPRGAPTTASCASGSRSDGDAFAARVPARPSPETDDGSSRAARLPWRAPALRVAASSDALVLYWQSMGVTR